VKLELLQSIRDELGDCQRCKLHTTRNKIVFGNGSPEARIMIVGEAPGRDEDSVGEPFVGKSGQLLNKWLNLFGIPRETVFVNNTICCRPPDNRDPDPEETNACSPFLLKKIEALKPQIIITLGRPAARLMLENDAPLGSLRGKVFERYGAKIIPTYHPSYIMRNGLRDEAKVYDDLMVVLDEMLKLGVAPTSHIYYEPALNKLLDWVNN
jgi:uracil-DNA glycosylase